MRLSLLCAVCLALFAGTPGHADSFKYVVSFSSGGYTANAAFTTPSLITAPTTITSFDSSSSSSGTISSVFLYPSLLPSPLSYSFFQFNGIGNAEILQFSQALTSPGVFQAQNGLGTLAITDPASVTPEPASFALLGTGLFGMAAFVRRRAR